MQPLKLLATWVVAASLLLSPTHAYADDPHPPQTTPDPTSDIILQSVVTNRTQITQQIPVQTYAPDGSVSVVTEDWVIEYANGAAYGINGANKYVQHLLARTRKIAGIGPYQAEAHATLIKGNSYSVPPVFDQFIYPCAFQVVNDNTAQTCPSPWQPSTTGQQWFIISGHSFDIGGDGIKDTFCPGCIDFVFTTP